MAESSHRTGHHQAFDPHEVEARWQRHWEEIGLFRADTSAAADRTRRHRYVLVMFPYPSGSLHMGHVLNYTLGDAIVRYHLMRGENVLSPIGWDALGLPAESAAINAGIHPHDWTSRNIAEMRAQMRAMGWGYDWQREVGTHTPEYYRWTQWLFLAMAERGLAYRKEALVNWCPEHETVLANEQVVDGACERCRTPVVKRKLEQWFFRITSYTERLLAGLDTLDQWPEKVKKRQRDWIGKSHGARVEFVVPVDGHEEPLPVFTTRADTLRGVTFMAIAPEHPLVERILASPSLAPALRQRLRDFVARVLAQSAIERGNEATAKEGIDTGLVAINPVDGRGVPLFVANYVLMDYGTGAVMAVPAHDQRDFEFARAYGLDVRVVIQPPGGGLDAASMTAAFVDDGIQADGSEFAGLPNAEARTRIVARLAERGLAEPTVHYRLRDWLISRQRYWGVPIPMIYDQAGTPHAVPADELPVIHPRDVAFSASGGNPLSHHQRFVDAPVPGTGAPGRRETDTMDTFVDSSWYFCPYLAPHLTTALTDAETARRWLPVDLYIGGDEHAVLHLMYARFITKVLKDLGLVEVEEPFKRLFCQGMVCREAYQLQSDHTVWVPWQDVDAARGVRSSDGAPVRAEMGKMSKSKKNGVSPDHVVARFGADVLRTYILFVGPPDKELIYQDDCLIGIDRFLRRFRDTIAEIQATAGAAQPYAGDGADLNERARALWRKSHQVIAAFTRTAEETFAWNTALARLMELINEVRTTLSDAESGKLTVGDPDRAVLALAADTATRMLAPVAPHLAEETWRSLGHTQSVFRSGWPAASAEACREEAVEIVFQVNGKICGTEKFQPGVDQGAVAAAARANEKVAARLVGKTVVKEIFVANKLFNLVVR